MVSTLDTYGWVEIFFFTTNLLGQLLLKDICLIIVYEYKKIMLFYVMKSFVLFMFHVIMFDYSHENLVCIYLYGFVRVYLHYILVISPMHALYFIMFILGSSIQLLLREYGL